MEEQAFHALYAATAKPLWAYIARVSGRPDVANDLLQETYCRFLASQVSEGGTRGDQTVPVSYRDQSLARSMAQRRGYNMGPNPKRSASERDLDTQIDVRDLMQQLKPRERQLLWLAYVEGMTHSEIAKSTGLQSMSVRILLFRARRRAAELLGPKEKAVHEV